jgi:hypothetical protein
MPASHSLNQVDPVPDEAEPAQNQVDAAPDQADAASHHTHAGSHHTHAGSHRAHRTLTSEKDSDRKVRHMQELEAARRRYSKRYRFKLFLKDCCCCCCFALPKSDHSVSTSTSEFSMTDEQREWEYREMVRKYDFSGGAMEEGLTPSQLAGMRAAQERAEEHAKLNERVQSGWERAREYNRLHEHEYEDIDRRLHDMMVEVKQEDIERVQRESALRRRQGAAWYHELQEELAAEPEKPVDPEREEALRDVKYRLNRLEVDGSFERQLRQGGLWWDPNHTPDSVNHTMPAFYKGTKPPRGSAPW